MRITTTGGAAALLVCALAAPAWAQTASEVPARAEQPADDAQTGAQGQTATGAAGASTQQPTDAAQTGAQNGAQSQTATGAAGTSTQPSDAAQTGTQGGTATEAAGATAGQPADAARTGTEEQPEPAAGQTAQQPADADKGYAMGDVVLGDPDAPLTVIEYASFTCPHCATFALHTFPEIKEQYVDTGKVKFILREVYFDQYGLWASMVARCGGEQGFYPLAESLLATQSTWTRAPDIGHAIQQVGRRAGLTGERLEQCLSDRDFAKDLLATYQENMAADEVKSTPTFIIGDETHTGAMSVEDFSALLDAQL